MHRYFRTQTSLLLILSTIFIFIESFIGIIMSDFIQAFTVLASRDSSPASLAGLSENVRHLYDLGSTNLIIITISVAIGGVMFGIFGVFFSSKVGANFIAIMRQKTFEQIQTFSPKDIDHFGTPSLITRMTTDAEIVANAFLFGLRFLTSGAFAFIFGLTKSIIEFREMSIIYAGIIPFMFLAIVVIGIKALPNFDGAQKAQDEVNRSVRESILGVRVVKAYNLEENQRNRFSVSNTKLTANTMRAFTWINILSPIITLTVSVVPLFVYIVGYSSGDQSVFVQMIGFSSILMQVLFGFLMTIIVFVQGSRAIPSFVRINKINKHEVSMTYGDDAAKEIKEGTIELKNISHWFNPNEEATPILKNINIKIEPKQKIGIVGSTGSGKTTLVNLITRNFDPSHGEVFIDGVDIKEYSSQELRKNISIAIQAPTIFSGTIGSNIQMGLNYLDHENQDLIKEEVIKAAKAAEAWEFISKKPGELEHKVEQRGKNFSGGQKQRISIARTLAMKSKIVIFDDSTSALDTITEKKVQNNMKKYNNATTIIVAQRISSVEKLDKIIVLDKGQIVGFDKHWNLLKNNETYRSIAASQLGTEELNEILIKKGMVPIEK